MRDPVIRQRRLRSAASGAAAVLHRRAAARGAGEGHPRAPEREIVDFRGHGRRGLGKAHAAPLVLSPSSHLRALASAFLPPRFEVGLEGVGRLRAAVPLSYVERALSGDRRAAGWSFPASSRPRALVGCERLGHLGLRSAQLRRGGLLHRRRSALLEELEEPLQAVAVDPLLAGDGPDEPEHLGLKPGLRVLLVGGVRRDDAAEEVEKPHSSRLRSETRLLQRLGGGALVGAGEVRNVLLEDAGGELPALGRGRLRHRRGLRLRRRGVSGREGGRSLGSYYGQIRMGRSPQKATSPGTSSHPEGASGATPSGTWFPPPGTSCPPGGSKCRV